MKHKLFIAIIIGLIVIAAAVWYFAVFSIKPEPARVGQSTMSAAQK